MFKDPTILTNLKHFGKNMYIYRLLKLVLRDNGLCCRIKRKTSKHSVTGHSHKDRNRRDAASAAAQHKKIPSEWRKARGDNSRRLQHTKREQIPRSWKFIAELAIQ